jgi:hypothetical protein
MYTTFIDYSMASGLLLLLGVSAICAILCLFLRYWRLKAVPGPYLASVTDFWMFRTQYFGSILPKLVDLHRHYGNVVRIGPNRISVSSAAYVKTIYTNRGEFKKVDWSHLHIYASSED